MNHLTRGENEAIRQEYNKSVFMTIKMKERNSMENLHITANFI